jgi:hypothetical protein
MFDRDYIGAWDLAGRDVVITIKSVTQGELKNGKSKNKKPIIKFCGADGKVRDKGFALNKTNCKTIAAMYGNDTRAWVDKKIKIFATTTSFGSETVDCIRVRPGIPSERGGSNERAAAPQQPTNDWREVLGLGTSATKQDVEDAYAQLYADAEGDEARIAVLSSARGYALKELADDDE